MTEQFVPRMVTQFFDPLTGIGGTIEHRPEEPKPYKAHISRQIERFRIETQRAFVSLPEAESWLEEVQVMWTAPAKRQDVQRNGTSR